MELAVNGNNGIDVWAQVALMIQLQDIWGNI